MDYWYACPQLFALILSNYSIRGVGTCKANRKGFDSDMLPMDKKADRGKFIRLVDKILGMAITCWKDSKLLQVMSNVMKKGADVVQRRKWRDILDATCPNDIIMYQTYMGGVDRGNQHCIMGAGFANVSHFKKLYKNAFMRLCDFRFLNAFVAWNLTIKCNTRRGRGDCFTMKRLLKWEFYSVAAEEMMTYVEHNENIDLVQRSVGRV